MNDKFVAGLVTAVVIAPICALCILGTVVLTSGFAFISAWLGGINPLMATGLAIIAAIVVLGLVRRRKGRPAGYPAQTAAAAIQAGDDQPKFPRPTRRAGSWEKDEFNE